MRIKFVIAVMLAVVCLVPIAAGVSTAQQDEPNKANLDYKVYLPIVAKPLCTLVHPTAYIAVSKPIMKVGDYLTITGALMNDCAIVGQPRYHLGTQPEGLLFPSYIITDIYPNSIDYGAY